MSKLFVTVLGTGNYFDCLYYKDDKYKTDECVKTPFIQDALIKFLYKEKQLDFNMKILLTDKAKKANYHKLQPFLKKHNVDPILVSIEDGKNDNELLNIFNNVHNEIDKSANDLLEKHKDIISKCYELNDILFKYNNNIKSTTTFTVTSLKDVNNLCDIFDNTCEEIKSIKQSLQELLNTNKDLETTISSFIITKDNIELTKKLDTLKDNIDENKSSLFIELKEIITKYHELENMLTKLGYDIEPELNKSLNLKNKFTRNFNKLTKIILENLKDLLTLDVTIDITHSLRHIPMQIVVAMNYLTVFNDVNIEGIYYGAFELGETTINTDIFSNSNDKISKLKNKKELALKIESMRDKNQLDNDIAKSLLNELRQDAIDINILNELDSATSIDDLNQETINIITRDKSPYRDITIKRAPICNLNTYYDLLRWTNAINSFLICGNTLEMKNIIDNNIMLGSDNLDLVKNVVISLNNFTNSINTCRGKFYKSKSNNKKQYEKEEENNNKKSIKSAAEKLNEELIKLNEGIKDHPLAKLFNIIREEIKPFINKSDLEIGIATVDWCIKYNLYQQGYTALDESLKTLICVKLKDFYSIDINEYDIKIDETNTTDREEIANVILTCVVPDKQTHGYKPKSTETIIFKDLNDENKKQIALNGLNVLSNNTKFYKFVNSVKNYRNDINHFGFKANGASVYTTLSDELLNLRDQLVKYSQGDFPWYPVENTSEENPQSEVAADSSQI